MSDAYGMAEILEAIETEAKQTFTWSGGTYACMAGSLVATKDIDPGGFALQADRQIVVRRALFPESPPQLKQVITMDGRSLRIDSVETSPDGAFLILSCNDPTRGI